MNEYHDYPIYEVLARMKYFIANGHDCFVKFTCEKCGARNTDEIPNRYCAGGYTCGDCGHLTHPKGINFLLVAHGKTE